MKVDSPDVNGGNKIVRIPYCENASSIFIDQNRKKRLYPEIRIPSSIREIDEIMGGFKAGQVSWVSGTSSLIKRLPYQLCVNTVETFQSDTLFIDGGSNVNPYYLSMLAKQKEQNIAAVLDQVHISRAFTVHQLSSLITERMKPVIKQYHPQTVILNDFPALFFDPDVSFHESQVLLKSVFSTIQQLTKQYQLISVLTFQHSSVQQQTNHLLSLVQERSDEILQMNTLHNCTRIVFPKKNKMTTVIGDVFGQLSLMDFGMVM